MLVALIVCTVGSEVVVFVILGVGDNDTKIGGSRDTAEGAVVWLKIGLKVSGNGIIEG